MRKSVAIVGIGQSEFKKNIGKNERRIALEAIKNALTDAGISPHEVDGLVRFNMENLSEVEVARNLGIENLRFFGEIGYGGGGACATVAHAQMAIETDRANVVVCWRARNRGSGVRPWAATGNRVPGDDQFSAPFGCVRPVDQIAMLTRRYMHEFGATWQHLGKVAVTIRDNATRNPQAMMQKPMTLADYEAARYVSEPLRLFDCCLESDGALAVVVVSAERARDLRNKPAYVLAASQGTGPDHVVMTNYYKKNFLETPSKYAAEELYRQAGVTAKDIDCAQFYDAFTPLVLFSLEEYGFCKPGEAPAFVDEGRIGPKGDLPVNTSGSSLSEAYVHGMNLIVEGVRQIRGTSTSQVKDAELSLVTSGAGVPTSAMILAGNPS